MKVFNCDMNIRGQTFLGRNMFTDTWFESLEQELAEDICADQGRLFRTKPLFTNNINLKAERPFSSLGNRQLLDAISFSLQRVWSAFELSTLLIEEAEHRNASLKREVNRLIKKEDFSPIPWLIKARECLRSESSAFRTGGATASNYFVLLVREGKYECYVGQTATTKLLGMRSRQEARIVQHFSGIRASRHVKKYGHEPLWSLNCFTEKVQWTRRIEAETTYNNSLTKLGIKVRGDLQT